MILVSFFLHDAASHASYWELFEFFLLYYVVILLFTAFNGFRNMIFFIPMKS